MSRMTPLSTRIDVTTVTLALARSRLALRAIIWQPRALTDTAIDLAMLDH